MRGRRPIFGFLLFAFGLFVAVILISQAMYEWLPADVQKRIIWGAAILVTIIGVADRLWKYFKPAQPGGARPEPKRPVPKSAVMPPTPFYIHPYGGASFVGRETELKMLSEWAGSGERPVLVLLAPGGMGKSALAWEWWQERATGFEGIFWWDFYSNPFEQFANHALLYLSGGRLDPAELGRNEVTRALVDRLEEKRYLLVLDGFERELRGYEEAKGAYQSENGSEPEEEREDRRETIDPSAQNFLRGLGNRKGLKGKVLLTSREFPADLADEGGSDRPNVRQERLGGLSLDDAITLFRDRDIKAHRGEVADVCEPLGYHALTLVLLAGLIAEDPETPNDFSRAREYTDADTIEERRNKVLRIAFEGLTPAHKALLERISAFRGAVSYEALARVAELSKMPPGERAKPATPDGLLSVDDLLRRMGGQPIAVQPEPEPPSTLSKDEVQELKDGLKSLRRRELVLATKDGRYDLHLLVRAHACGQMDERARQETHALLRDYIGPEAARVNTKQVARLEDLEPVIELYHHTLNAGNNDAALDLYYARLNRPLYYQLGAYQTMIELLRPLFADGENRPPRLSSEIAQAWMANMLSAGYALSGQPARAISVIKVGLAIVERQDDKENLATDLGNLATQQHLTGALAEAAANLRRGIALAGEVGNKDSESVGSRELGHVLAYAGNYEEAGQAFDVWQKYEDSDYEAGRFDNAVVTVRAYRSELHLLRGEAKAALAAAQAAQSWHERVSREVLRSERDFIRNAWLLGAARRALGDLNKAEGHLSEALARCRRINMVDHEAAIMLELAHTRRDQGRPEEALELAEDALVIADRSEYRLQQADIHYLLALLAQDAGDIPTAREHAEQARERALCEGEMHYDRTLKQAEKLLEKLA